MFSRFSLEKELVKWGSGCSSQVTQKKKRSSRVKMKAGSVLFEMTELDSNVVSVCLHSLRGNIFAVKVGFILCRFRFTWYHLLKKQVLWLSGCFVGFLEAHRREKSHLRSDFCVTVLFCCIYFNLINICILFDICIIYFLSLTIYRNID